MYSELLSKQKKLSVIGLGYVGLPIALEFAKKLSVIGFDIKPERIEILKKGLDPSNELSSSDFQGCDILFASNPDDLEKASFHIIAVPTPIDEHNLPNLQPLLSATKTLSKYLKKGDYVVYESTVYPGCTEEDCVPILEQGSSLKYIQDFKVGYSPERINPGDKEHTLTKIVKVVSGCDEDSLEIIAKVYEIIIKAGIHKVSSIKVAEAAKIIENTQRDVNIALMNELSIIFNRMGINTYEVLEAAATKWNFHKFYPGLVGGHCIGVDPYYLVYKAKEYDYHAQIVTAGRFINDSMSGYVAKQTVKKIIANNPTIGGINNARVLVMGITFKENVSDIRNSKVAVLINELKSYGVKVDAIDPNASAQEVKEHYGLDLREKIETNYDAVIVAVAHKEYLNYDEKFFRTILSEKGILVDVKGIYRNKIKELEYWSL